MAGKARVLVVGDTRQKARALVALLQRKRDTDVAVALVSNPQTGEKRATEDFGAEVSVRECEDIEELCSHVREFCSPRAIVVDVGESGEEHCTAEATVASGAHYVGITSHCYVSQSVKATAEASGAVEMVRAGDFTALASSAITELRDGMEKISLIDISVTPELFSTQKGRQLSQLLSSTVADCWRGGTESKATVWSERKTFSLPRGEEHYAYIVGGPETVKLAQQFDARAVMVRSYTRQPIVDHILHGGAILVGLGMPFHVGRPLACALVSDKGRREKERAGMSVVLAGTTNGRAVEREWTVDFPVENVTDVSMLSALCLLERLRAGTSAVQSGGEFSLSEWTDAASELDIDQRMTERPHSFVFRQGLGEECWSSLPEEIRRTHEVWDQEIFEGSSSVERGSNIFCKIMCTLLGFPRNSDSIPVKVTKTKRLGMNETWVRDFAGSIVTSYLKPGGLDTPTGTLYETFLPFTFQLDLHMEAHPSGRRALKYDVVRGWAFKFIPLPMWILPVSETFEYVEDGVFHFDVDITLPFFGRMVRYRGKLL